VVKGDLVLCIQACSLDGCNCMNKGNIGICEETPDGGYVKVKWIHGDHLRENERSIHKNNIKVITHGRN